MLINSWRSGTIRRQHSSDQYEHIETVTNPHTETGTIRLDWCHKKKIWHMNSMFSSRNWYSFPESSGILDNISSREIGLRNKLTSYVFNFLISSYYKQARSYFESEWLGMQTELHLKYSVSNCKYYYLFRFLPAFKCLQRLEPYKSYGLCIKPLTGSGVQRIHRIFLANA